MKSLTLCLPDMAYDRAASDASNRGVDVASLCASILADHLLAASAIAVAPDSAAKPKSIPSTKFSVAEHFKAFPLGSIRFAQTFVDEALKFPGVEAFQLRRGIGFRPNFVFIEYLMSRGGKAGIGVSFYGEPSRHKNPPEILVKGIPSYSRAKIYNDSELQAILPHIRQSFELRYGSL